MRDVEEVLEELGGNVLIDVVVRRQFQRDPQEVERVHRHPRGAVGLVDITAGRQRLRAIEHADVVETEEPALEDVPPCASLRLTHQVSSASACGTRVPGKRDRCCRSVADRSDRPARRHVRGPAD